MMDSRTMNNVIGTTNSPVEKTQQTHFKSGSAEWRQYRRERNAAYLNWRTFRNEVKKAKRNRYFEWNAERERIAQQKEAAGLVHIGPSFMIEARQQYLDKLFQSRKTQPEWKAYAVIRQDSESCDEEVLEGLPAQVVDRNNPLLWKDKRRRPCVVCVEPHCESEDEILETKLQKMWKRVKKIFPCCPYTQLPEKDCWCMHRVHDSVPTSSDCSSDVDVLFVDDASSVSSSNSGKSVSFDIPGLTDSEEDLRAVQEMPLSESDEEYHVSVLIHIYLKECVENVHHMIGLWTHQHTIEIREACMHLLTLCKNMDKLVGGVFYLCDKNESSVMTLPQQKERMFVDTSNIAIRLNQCNKIVNDHKELHKIRTQFLLYSRAAKVEVGSIRTFVNEATFKAVQEMEPHGDPDFSMPHQRNSTQVAFTGDKAQDENAMFKLGRMMNIVDVVERCKIESRLDVISYNTSMAAGTSLARYRVSPNYCPRYTDSGTRTYNQTALCNYANMYQFWKGSIIYTFEVIRTSFHMGQILIAFNPASIAAPTLTACTNLIYKIMDLKETNRMDFEVEYVGETEYKQCVSSIYGPAVPGDAYVDIANVGTLNVFVFTPLTAPAIVSAAVDINVYVRAGDNFTFKTPTNKIPTLTYYNVRTAAYQEMETSYDSELPPVVAQPPQGMAASSERLEVARAAKLQTADTLNIGGKRYPLVVGIAWDTTDTITGGALSTVLLPRDVLNAAQFSINGLINYHAFFRGTFTIIFQMDAPLQYAGALILFYVPNGIDYTQLSNSTWKQFPHVMFNPANETIAELEIPWSYVTPMNNLDPNGSLNTMGRVYLAVWNNLQIPVSGVNTLTGAISFKMNDPEILVKRTNYTYAAVLEMPEPTTGGGSTIIKQTSDTARKIEDDGGVFQGKPLTMQGLMIQQHTSVLNLLQRVDFAPTQDCTSVVTANWQQVLTLPPFFGTMHNFLRNSYAFSNGSNKITYVIPVGANRGVTMATFPSFSDSTFSDAISNTSVAISDNVIFYQGTSVWRPGLAIEHSIEVPYYHRDPVISIPETGVASQSEYANVVLAAFNNDTATAVFVQPGHTVGPDYKLYFPIAYGQFQGPIPASVEKKKEPPMYFGNVGARTVDQIAEQQKEFPKEYQIQLPKPPFANIPRPIVDRVIDHVVEKTGLNKATISDIGQSLLHAKGHHEIADALAESLQMRPMPGRRKRELPTCEFCVSSDMDCKWPDCVAIPYMVDPGPGRESYYLDYDSVYVHCHRQLNRENVLKAFKIPELCTDHHKKGVLEMPAGGFTGVTTNTQVISQAFPGIFTVGQVNVTTFTASATLTSGSSTDLVDIEYTISNAGDTISYYTTVAGNGAGSSIVFGPITFNSTPVNALSDVTITAIGTGVVEHSATMQSYSGQSSSSVASVSIVGQPIQVTEYALLTLAERRNLAQFRHYMKWVSKEEDSYDTVDFVDSDLEIDFKAVQEMPSPLIEPTVDDEFEDCFADAEPTEDDRNCVNKLVQDFYAQAGTVGNNIVSVFKYVFTGILNAFTSKYSESVKRTACEKIKEKLHSITTHVLDKIIPVLIWIIDFVANLYVLFNTESTTMRTLMIASLTAKCILAFREGTQLVNKLEELFGLTKKESIRAVIEGPFDENLPVISGLVASAMVAGILGILGYNVMGSDVTDVRKMATWKFAESCAMLSKISSVTKSVPTLWTAAHAGINTAIQFFVEGPDCFKNWEEKNHEHLIQWQREVDLCIKNNLFINENLFKEHLNADLMKENNFQRLQRLTDFATEIRTFGSSIPRFNMVWLRSAENIMKIHATAVKTMQAAGGRSEPVGIIIRGAAGCGKSLLFTQFLPHAVMSVLGLSSSLDESKQKTYAKPTDPKADFWDGYLGAQHVWVNVDDFGQVRTEEDIGSMYNLISASDAPVNMAALEEKGILFVSDFVCCTTNLTNFTQLLTIRDPKALVRRFPIALECSVNSDYQKRDGTLDHAKMIELLRTSGADARQRLELMNRVWTFKEYDFTNSLSGSVVHVVAVVERIVDAYRRRKQGLTDFTSLINDIDFSKLQLDVQPYQKPTRQTLLKRVEFVEPKGRVTDSGDDDETDLKFVDNLSAEEEMFRNSAGANMRKHYAFNDDSDDELFIPRSNPVQNRKDFVCRVLEKCNGDLLKLSYFDAQSFLRELKYLDKHEYYKVTNDEFVNCVDDPSVTLNCENGFSATAFLVMVARLRLVKEDQVNNGLPVTKWEGLVKFCLKWMGIISLGVVAIWLLKKMFTALFQKVVDPLGVPEGPHYDNAKVVKNQAPSRVPYTNRAFKATQQMNERQTIVSNNMRFIRLHTAEQVFKMNCVAMDSRYIIIPDHYFVAYEDARRKGDFGAHFQLEIRRKGVVNSAFMPISITPQNSVQLNGVDSFADKKLDARLVYLHGNPIFGAKSIWNHLMTIENFAFYAHSRQLAYLLAPQSGLLGQKVILDYGHAYLYKDARDLIGKYHILGKMAIMSQGGDCGRVYVHSAIQAQHVILGMHTVGIKECEDINIAMTPLIRESLDEAKDFICSMCDPVDHIEPFSVLEMKDAKLDAIPSIVEKYWSADTMPLLGKLTVNNEPLQRFTPEDTKFLPIVIHDRAFVHQNWRNEFLPSVKKAVKVGDNYVHPLFTGAQKYERQAQRVVPIRYSINAFEHYKKRLPADREARTLTDYEAINGYGTIGHLVMTTGAGYLGNWFSKGKTEIFQPIEQRVRDDGSVMTLEYEWSEKAKTFKIPIWDKTIVELYDLCEIEIQQGRQMPTFWVSTLKDELVSLEKARIAKTRVFEQPCVIYSLLCRKYFGYFAEYFKRHAGFRLHHGIGKDKNVVWGRYLEILRQKGGYGFDVDYKNYDGTVQPAAFEFFLMVTDHFYGLVDRTARHALISNLQCSLHLVGMTLAESSQGNKSGNPLTDLFNSITNTWLVYVIYQMTREANGLSTDMVNQPQDFDFLTYGDDVIIAATEECLTYFNRVTFAEIAKVLGMTVTAANKSAIIEPYESIYELTFLKSPFVPRAGYVAAPLPKKIIYRELMWETKACVGDQTIFHERIKNALEFMAHHGNEEYQNLRVELAQLGVRVEDRFVEWENEMREKQLYPEVEDGIGRMYVSADDLFLDLVADEADLEIEWDSDEWLYMNEE